MSWHSFLHNNSYLEDQIHNNLPQQKENHSLLPTPKPHHIPIGPEPKLENNGIHCSPDHCVFFENATQMGLDHRVRVYLQDEGIDEVGDLGEFPTYEALSQVLENC